MLPGQIFAASPDKIRNQLEELRSSEQNLIEEYQPLEDRARSLSAEIDALRPKNGSDPGLIKRGRLEGLLSESKELETALREVETRLVATREEINRTRDKLILALTDHIDTLEQAAAEKKDPDILKEILFLRKEKERLLDESFTQLTPRIVFPVPDPGDTPEQVEVKLEILDLARLHLEQQLGNLTARLAELRRQNDLNRGLKEFLEDTYDFSREVSRRDELLARSDVTEEPGGSFPTDPFPIPDQPDTCFVCTQSSGSTIQHLDLTGSGIAPGITPTPDLTIDERISQLRTRKTTIEELIRRVERRQREIEKAAE